jgi:hypothetical protein
MNLTSQGMRAVEKILLDLEFQRGDLACCLGEMRSPAAPLAWSEVHGGYQSCLCLSVSQPHISLSVRHIPTCAWTHHTMLKSVSCIVCLTSRKILLISVMGHCLSSHMFPYYSASEELILHRDNESLKSNQNRLMFVCVKENIK